MNSWDAICIRYSGVFLLISCITLFFLLILLGVAILDIVFDIPINTLTGTEANIYYNGGLIKW